MYKVNAIYVWNTIFYLSSYVISVQDLIWTFYFHENEVVPKVYKFLAF